MEHWTVSLGILLRDNPYGFLHGIIVFNGGSGNSGLYYKNLNVNGNESTYKTTKFRALHTRSNQLSKEEFQLYQRGDKWLSPREKRNLGAIYERLLSWNNGTGYSFRTNLEAKQKHMSDNDSIFI